MPLGVISRFHLDFGVIFGEKRKKEKLENLAFLGSYAAV